ncbi:MAG: hypothetical protein H5U06_04865 [Candidatus Aminicenantes bacterium]|nr:hypothetical protein [Candidatus Aminicenantes bacterium]
MKKHYLKNVLIISFLFFQAIISYPQAIRIKLINKIPIDENALLLSGSFVVLKDGTFLFADIKDENSQFKLINENGKLKKGWGKMGPGPDEFGGIAWLDYNDKYLAAFDAGKQCVHLFEINKNEFRKKGDIMAWEVDSFIKLYDRSVLMGGYVVSPNEKKYIIFKRDFSGKNTEYILPLEYKYGGNSLSEYKKIREEVQGVSYKGYADIYEDLLFYVSDVRLKVIKTDLKTKK